jgi:hypothetical protein
MGGAVALAALVMTPAANASPITNYGTINAGPICKTLDDYPTVAGVTGVLSAVMEDSGFSAYQAGEVVGWTVATFCPSHIPELKRFVAIYSAPAETAQHLTNAVKFGNDSINRKCYGDTFVASGPVGGRIL